MRFHLINVYNMSLICSEGWLRGFATSISVRQLGHKQYTIAPTNEGLFWAQGLKWFSLLFLWGQKKCICVKSIINVNIFLCFQRN